MKVFFLIACLGFGSAMAAPSFTETAWREITPTYAAIVEHPFNRELASGELSRERFDFYSAQDALYLVEFGRVLGVLATKITDRTDAKRVLTLAIDCLEERKGRALTAAMAPATFHYVNYLLAVSAYGGPEELAAALLPCFWIYLRVAEAMRPRLGPKHPYEGWIVTYSSASYRKSVETMIGVTDRLAEKATSEKRKKMLSAFAQAARFEWYFWDGAYARETWQPPSR